MASREYSNGTMVIWARRAGKEALDTRKEAPDEAAQQHSAAGRGGVQPARQGENVGGKTTNGKSSTGGNVHGVRRRVLKRTRRRHSVTRQPAPGDTRSSCSDYILCMWLLPSRHDGWIHMGSIRHQQIYDVYLTPPSNSTWGDPKKVCKKSEGKWRNVFK
jgi:hypothetical protein